MDLGKAAGSLRAGLANEKRDDRRSLVLRVGIMLREDRAGEGMSSEGGMESPTSALTLSLHTDPSSNLTILSPNP